ncbi:MAG TPA: universal stress protein [Methylocystis sp.]|nr:universal stress protein [Methylocystis sp.]
MFGKILLPIDITEPEMGKLAAQEASVLAKAFNSELRLVNVQSLLPIAVLDYVEKDFESEILEGLEQEVSALADGIDCPRERLSTKILFGPVHHKVLAEAEAWGADLIVLCSHGSGPDRFLIGSTATAIMQRAKCSVWVVRR